MVRLVIWDAIAAVSLLYLHVKLCVIFNPLLMENSNLDTLNLNSILDIIMLNLMFEYLNTNALQNK